MSHSGVASGLAGATPRRIDRLLSPVWGFMQHRLAGAGLLLIMTALAVVLANSPFAHFYHSILETPLAFQVGPFSLRHSLHHWINDGLMSVFFFVVGLEIKRELLIGEISTLKKAALPAIAAIGGMVVPALSFVLLNRGTSSQAGWGIPMATDIAFALGVLAILGSRIPLGIKVFLTALAIVDDIGAVLVIAVFYTSHIDTVMLGYGFACLGFASVLNFLEVRNGLLYFAVGALMWLFFLKSGVHATIAAILMAFAIPTTTRIDGAGLLERLRNLMSRLEEVGLPQGKAMNTPAQQSLLTTMNQVIDAGTAPLQNIETSLHGLVTFAILPLFALANAGVSLAGDLRAALLSTTSLGIILGLFVGKQIGITLATWLSVKLRLAELPEGVTWSQVHGASVLGGIGFTMSLFVAGLAFSDAEHLEFAKLGILFGSLISALSGVLLLIVFTPKGSATGEEESASS